MDLVLKRDWMLTARLAAVGASLALLGAIVLGFL